jgi:hypothetical protein
MMRNEWFKEEIKNIQFDTLHYGIVHMYRDHYGTGYGSIRGYLPYLEGKHWKIFTATFKDIAPNPFLVDKKCSLRVGDLVLFRPFDQNTSYFYEPMLAARNIKVVGEHFNEEDVVKMYFDDKERFNRPFAEHKSVPIIEPALPQIEKGPKPIRTFKVKP